MAKGVFQTTDKSLGALTEHRLAVGFARATQDDAENPGFGFATIAANDGRAGSKIDLSFFRGLNFDAADPLRIGLAKPAHKAFNGLIGTGELNFQLQILVDSLRG